MESTEWKEDGNILSIGRRFHSLSYNLRVFQASPYRCESLVTTVDVYARCYQALKERRFEVRLCCYGSGACRVEIIASQ